MSKYIPPDKLLFLSPWLQGRGRCLVNIATVIVYRNDMAKMWPWYICRVWILHETRAMKCLRRNAKFKWSLVFSLVLRAPAELSTSNFFLSQAVGLVGAAGAGRGRSGRWTCCELEMRRVSKQLVKQRAGHIWSAVPQPYQIIWLD